MRIRQHIVPVLALTLLGAAVACGASSAARVEPALDVALRAAGSLDGPTRSDNDCAHAILVGWNTTTPVLLDSPYVDVLDPKPSCWTGAAYNLRPPGSVWFRFVAGETTAYVNTCEAPADPPVLPDTVVAVWRGTCGGLTQVACGDDNCDKKSSLVATGLTIGESYYVSVARWSAAPESSGNYLLAVNAFPCSLPCASPNRENEFAPWLGNAYELNGGCQSERGFAELGCGETICGTADKFSGHTDTDWYRLWLPQAATVQVSFAAQFTPRVRLIRPAAGSTPCVGFATLATNNPAGYQPCSPGSISSAGALVAGEYWITMSPDTSAISVPAGAQYQFTVTTDPCLPPTGACCHGFPAECTLVASAAACEAHAPDGLDGMYWGDGSSCAAVSCWDCPAGATLEGELECNDDYQDTFNAGCPASLTQPPLSWITFTELPQAFTLCGTSGTHLRPAEDPNTNLRDNDWYALALPGDAGDRVQVDATVVAELPVEVFLAAFDAADPCGTWWALQSQQATERLEPLVLSTCFTKTASTGPQGDLWLVVRPLVRGTPREIPCGLRYSLEIHVEPCEEPGACCIAAVCQEAVMQANCIGQGGTFGGQETTCGDICCPCRASDTSEAETQCGWAAFDPVNGGCVSGDPLLAPRARLIVPGQHYCGTVGLFSPGGPGGLYPDFDFYAVQLTQPGELAVRVTFMDGSTDMVRFVLSRVPNWPTSCAGAETQLIETPVPLPCVPTEWQIADLSPGWYLVGLTVIPVFPPPPPACYPYQITVSAGARGACCLADQACAEMLDGDCTAAAGIFRGAGTTCTPNPCVCRGDANCDGAVGFADIDYFVAAIPENQAAWEAKFAPGVPACRFESCDANANGTVGFDDIDPFVARLPSACN